MDDWKNKLRNNKYHGVSDNTLAKVCKICNIPLKNNRFDTCFKCSQQNKSSTDGLPPEYVSKLENYGYFDEKMNLSEDFLTTSASVVAKSFGTGHIKLKNHQLRRFYGHAKAAENRLKMTGDWGAVNTDVKKLSPFASEAKGKDKIPLSFYEFIEKNIGAIKERKDFEDGFIKHFEAVVGYFTYHYPKS